MPYTGTGVIRQSISRLSISGVCENAFTGDRPERCDQREESAIRVKKTRSILAQRLCGRSLISFARPVPGKVPRSRESQKMVSA